MSYIKNIEKRVTSDLKLLKHDEVIDKATYEKLNQLV